MAAVRHSRVSMSVSMSLMQGGTQSAPQGAILAAAAPYYQTPAIPTDVQPDRPIGYGAFGVVWWVFSLYLLTEKFIKFVLTLKLLHYVPS